MINLPAERVVEMTPAELGQHVLPDMIATQTFSSWNYINEAQQDGRYRGEPAAAISGARRYTPSSGRFLQPDMYAGALANRELAQGVLTGNRYGFAGGNPIGFVETDGHMFAREDLSSIEADPASPGPTGGGGRNGPDVADPGPGYRGDRQPTLSGSIRSASTYASDDADPMRRFTYLFPSTGARPWAFRIGMSVIVRRLPGAHGYHASFDLSWSTEALETSMYISGFFQARTASGWQGLCIVNSIPGCQRASEIPGGRTPPGHPAGGGQIESFFQATEEVTAVRFGFALLNGGFNTANADPEGRQSNPKKPSAGAQGVEQGISSKGGVELPGVFRYLTCFLTGADAGQCRS